MWKRAIATAFAAACLAGCASDPPSPSDRPPWLDAQFGWDPALVKVSVPELFALDPALERRLAEPGIRDLPPARKLKSLIEIIFDKDRNGFSYRAGHSTTAAETWRNRSGDCLSLTVLAYSVSRALGISPVMQEVRTTPVYGRAGDFDVVNQHVNLIVTHVRDDLTETRDHEVLIDFEPDTIPARRGTPLDIPDILARYYNNVAVEAMARGDTRNAYAHFKAAIVTEPAYASPYGNLAMLYRRAGRDAEAERLLRRAEALGDNSGVALHGLHALLVDHGRMQEARDVEHRLQARQAVDPYHWIALGLADLEKGDPRGAADRLERAAELAPGFAEVHRYLAIAYARAGDARKARAELVLMERSGDSVDKVALLRQKLDRMREAAH